MSAPTIPQLEAAYFPASLGPGVPGWHDTMVTPHVDGVAYFAAIADALDALTGQGDVVYITSWCFDPTFNLRGDASQPTLETKLLTLASQNVDVRIIVGAPRFGYGTDGRSGSTADFWAAALCGALMGPLVEIIRNNIAAIRRMRSHCAPWNASKLLVDWSGRNDSRHEKVTIIFNSALNELRAFVGGIDYQIDRMATEDHHQGWWHDAGIELLGGAAAAAAANFSTRWIETTTLPDQRCTLDGVEQLFNPTINPDPLWTAAGRTPNSLPTTAPDGSYLGASVRAIRSYDVIRAYAPWSESDYLDWHSIPKLGMRETLDLLVQAIANAKSYIYIEDQTVNPSNALDLTGIGERKYNVHRHVFPALSDACANGVKVIFVTSGTNGPGAAAPASHELSTEIVSRILDPLTTAQRDNFAAFFVRDTKVHSKVALIDDEFALIGSANLWDRSMEGIESEVGVALVHEGGSSSLVADLRVRLWAGHQRVGFNPTVYAKLRPLPSSLGIFKLAWGSGGVSNPMSALSELVP